MRSPAFERRGKLRSHDLAHPPRPGRAVTLFVMLTGEQRIFLRLSCETRSTFTAKRQARSIGLTPTGVALRF